MAGTLRLHNQWYIPPKCHNLITEIQFNTVAPEILPMPQPWGVYFCQNIHNLFSFSFNLLLYKRGGVHLTKSAPALGGWMYHVGVIFSCSLYLSPFWECLLSVIRISKLICVNAPSTVFVFNVQQGYKSACIVRLFDPVKSPRCYAIIAHKT